MRNKMRIVLVVAAVTLYAALGWIAGLVILAVVVVFLVQRMLRARRALAPTVRCPWCGVDVSQYGSFSCASCHARTRGWAWRCAFCGAWSGHVECPACGMSIRNPLLGAP